MTDGPCGSTDGPPATKGTSPDFGTGQLSADGTLTVALPVEFLWELKAASALIPLAENALRKFLSRNKEQFPAIYRFQGTRHRRKRLLSGPEIRRIREMTLRRAAPRFLDLLRADSAVQR